MKDKALEQWMWILKHHHKNDLILELDALDCVELLWFLEELKKLRELQDEQYDEFLNDREREG